jgi:hypothetical protein
MSTRPSILGDQKHILLGYRRTTSAVTAEAKCAEQLIRSSTIVDQQLSTGWDGMLNSSEDQQVCRGIEGV